MSTENDSEFLPDPMDEIKKEQALEKTQMPIKEVKRILKEKFNIEEDELSPMGFNTEEKVREFYEQCAKKSSEIEAESMEADEDNKTAAPEDDYRLSPEQQKLVTPKEVKPRVEKKQKTETEPVKKKKAKRGIIKKKK